MPILRYFITSKAKRNLLRFFFTAGGADHYTREISRLTGEPLNAVRRELGYLEKAGMLHSYMQGNQKHYGIVPEFPFLAELKRLVLEADAATPVPAVPRASATESRTSTESPPTETAGPDQLSKDAPIVPGARVIMNHERRQPAVVPSSPPARGTFDVPSFVDYLQDKFRDVTYITVAIIHGEAARSTEIPPDGIDLLIVGDINKDALLELTSAVEDATGVHLNLTRMTRTDFDYRNAKGDPLIRRIWGEKKLVIKGRH